MKFAHGRLAEPVRGLYWLLAIVAALAIPSNGVANERFAPMPQSYDGGTTGTVLRDQEPACGECEACCSCCPCCCWQVWAGAMFLTRNSSRDIPLAFGDPNSPKGSEVFGTNDLDFGLAWGPNVGITYCLNPCNPCNRIGVEFYAIDGWTSTGRVEGDHSVQFPSLPYLPELTSPGDPTSGYGVATFRYASNLYNTEINFYHQSSNVYWLTTLAGFRWIEISEQFETVFRTGATAPNYSIDVNNHLYGFQVGTLLNLLTSGNWRFDGWVKAGIYTNFADQSTSEDFTSAGGGVTFVAARDTNAAFVSDLGVSATRRITDRLSLRLSYMALWIEGIALAPEQLDSSDPSNAIAGLNNGGGTFYHGGFVGCEYQW
jgi:hypothetical protein